MQKSIMHYNNETSLEKRWIIKSNKLCLKIPNFYKSFHKNEFIYHF